jgi:hypothetical protein
LCREQTHEDDLANEKLQQAVVQGELRKKRRNRGLGLDDSDEEDEEDEMRARKMRRGLHEPKIGGDVSKLGSWSNLVAWSIAHDVIQQLTIRTHCRSTKSTATIWTLGTMQSLPIFKKRSLKPDRMRRWRAMTRTRAES